MAFQEALRNLRRQQETAQEDRACEAEAAKAMQRDELDRKNRRILRGYYEARTAFKQEVLPVAQAVNEIYLRGAGQIDAEIPEDSWEECVSRLESEGEGYLNQAQPHVHLVWKKFLETHYIHFDCFFDINEDRGRIGVITNRARTYFEIGPEWKQGVENYVLELLENPKETRSSSGFEGRSEPLLF